MKRSVEIAGHLKVQRCLPFCSIDRRSQRLGANSKSKSKACKKQVPPPPFVNKYQSQSGQRSERVIH